MWISDLTFIANQLAQVKEYHITTKATIAFLDNNRAIVCGFLNTENFVAAL
ncbi:protein of unknown function (plasmid) [Azospirillum baldaniorum]|uniref:Uncharacterized protein n=1 Tax=Azospirillum baldaniorum TaxID=1064539 RepID=A0A9P1NR03_9PROT|nr:protein of unknown function [Azospirillum baldaniorum]